MMHLDKAKDEEEQMKLIWESFKSTKGADDKVAMIKKICGMNKSVDFYKRLGISDAIFNLEAVFIEEGNTEGYYNFLKFLMTEHPKIFNLDGQWYVRPLIYWYIFKGKSEEVRNAVKWFIENPREDPDIIGDVLDVLSMNGFPILARELLEVYYPLFKKGDKIVPWGLDELSEISGFFLIADHIGHNHGTSKPELKELENNLLRFDYEPDEKYFIKHIERVSGIRKDFKTWSKNDFRGENLYENIYYLMLDFVRYLNHKRNIDLACAHMIQNYVYEYVRGDIDDGNRSIFRLRRDFADRYLGSLCGFISLMQTRAFALLSGLRLFYEFLRDEGIITENTYVRAIKDIAYLKRHLYRAFKNELWKYEFAEKWLSDVNE